MPYSPYRNFYDQTPTSPQMTQRHSYSEQRRQLIPNPSNVTNLCDAAERNYKMWHKRNPDEGEAVRMSLDIPESLVCCGCAGHIVYASDKWNEDRRVDTYIHDFESSPKIYRKPQRGENGAVSTHELMNVPRRAIGGSMDLPQLGYAQELVWYDDNQQMQKLDLSQKNIVMSCSPDRKSVILLGKGFCVVIRGGQMTVQGRGIVK